jgi:hypothetical protein
MPTLPLSKSNAAHKLQSAHSKWILSLSRIAIYSRLGISAREALALLGVLVVFLATEKQ